MIIAVSCNTCNKPHKDAFIQVVGKGHKEWFLDVPSYDDIIEGRRATLSYNSYLLKLHLHFLDDGLKEVK